MTTQIGLTLNYWKTEIFNKHHYLKKIYFTIDLYTLLIIKYLCYLLPTNLSENSVKE